MTEHFSHTDQPFCVALRVAAEHCEHERRRGIRPSAVIRSVGGHVPAHATWEDAQRAVKAAWLAMALPDQAETESTEQLAYRKGPA